MWINWRHDFAAQHCGCAQHSLHRAQVSRAAAEHSAQHFTHLFGVGCLFAVQQLFGCHDHRRSAEAALDCSRVDERLLNGMKFVALGKSLYRVNALRVRLCGEHYASGCQVSIEQHGARAAVASLAAVLHGPYARGAQCVQQRCLRRALQNVRRAVNLDVYFHLAG